MRINNPLFLPSYIILDDSIPISMKLFLDVELPNYDIDYYEKITSIDINLILSNQINKKISEMIMAEIFLLISTNKIFVDKTNDIFTDTIELDFIKYDFLICSKTIYSEIYESNTWLYSKPTLSNDSSFTINDKTIDLNLNTKYNDRKIYNFNKVKYNVKIDETPISINNVIRISIELGLLIPDFAQYIFLNDISSDDYKDFIQYQRAKLLNGIIK